MLIIPCFVAKKVDIDAENKHEEYNYITLSTPLGKLTSTLFLATTSLHVLYAPPTPICCRFLGFTLPLPNAVSLSLSP